MVLSLLVWPAIAFAAVAGGDIQLRGLIVSRPAGTAIGTWQVDDLVFDADAGTRLEGDPARLVVNYCVEVKYRLVGATPDVSNIKAKDRKDCELVVKVRGQITALPADADLLGTWEIGGSSYTVDGNTEQRASKGPFETNACVEVTYGSTTLIATKVETREPRDCPAAPPEPTPQPAVERRVTDLIVARPVDQITGTWTIGTAAIDVDADTRIEGDADLLRLNYCAEARYLDDGSSAIASRLKSKPRRDCEPLIRLRAPIDVLPPTPGLTGTWIISSSAYSVDDNTELKADRVPFDAGVCVEVTYGATSLIATKIESRRPADCGLADPAVVLKAKALIDVRPATAPLGVWTIGGVDYSADATTRIDGGLDKLVPLACAEVEYTTDGSSNRALKLRSKPRSECEPIVRLIGSVEALPATPGLTGTWTISGTALTADTTTDIGGRTTDYAAGRCVEARYGADSLIMTRVERKNPAECGDAAGEPTTGEALGLIDARPGDTLTGTWTISATAYLADADTRFRDADKLNVGYCARVRYVVDAGGNLATEIKSEARDKCEPVTRLVGQIDILPATPGLTGTWTISGSAVIVDANTRLRTQEGPFAVDACVEAKYGTTTGLALEIKTRKARDCGLSDGGGATPLYARSYGVIEAFPLGMTGTWTINGSDYSATSTTVFKTKEGPLALGACARVDYLVADSSAIQIASAEAFHCAADGSGGHSDEDARVYGIVSSFPADLIGTWVVGGVSYETGFGTRFKQDGNGFELNSCVEVKYLADSLIALAIELESNQLCGADGPNIGSYTDYDGYLVSAPAVVTGTWTVDDQSFTADATTTLVEGFGALVPGACVKVTYQTSNGLALRIESQDLYYCGGSVTPPIEPEASLLTNRDSTANGGALIYTAAGLPRDTLATVTVNGVFVGSAWTDSNGQLTFGMRGILTSLPGGRAPLQTLETTVTTAETTLTDSFTIEASGEPAPLPQGYSAPVFNSDGPSGPTALTLAAQHSRSGSSLLLALAAVLTATAGALLLRRRAR